MTDTHALGGQNHDAPSIMAIWHGNVACLAGYKSESLSLTSWEDLIPSGMRSLADAESCREDHGTSLWSYSPQRQLLLLLCDLAHVCMSLRVHGRSKIRCHTETPRDDGGIVHTVQNAVARSSISFCTQ